MLWNRASEWVLGVQAGEVLGHPCYEVMRCETLAGRPFCSLSCAVGHRLGCGSGVRNFDSQTHTKAGKVIWLNVSSLPVPSRKKDRFLFAHLFRNITKRMIILGLDEELHTLLATPDGHPPSVVPDIPRRFLSVNGREKSCACWPGGRPPRGLRMRSISAR